MEIQPHNSYVKRSGLSGKARRVTPIADLGESVECIADDNGKTLIVRKSRLYADSPIFVRDTVPVSAELSRLLDKWLGVQ